MLVDTYVGVDGLTTVTLRSFILFDTKNGGNTFLRNVVELLPDYTAIRYRT
jgi:hypothetical protein